MKFSTQYLFNVPREYFEPEMTILAEKKIAKAKEFMQKIAQEKYTATIQELPALAERYMRAEEAYKHWVKLLEEE